MDPLLLIVTLASAILFSYLGYVAGNYFPVIKRQAKPKNSEPRGEKFYAQLTDRLNKWLGEEEIPPQPPPTIADQNVSAPSPAQTRSVKSSTPHIDHPQDTIRIVYDKHAKKVFAEIDGQVFDLDGPVTGPYKKELDFLLIELQERIGLAAELKAAVEKNIDQAAQPATQKEEEKRGGLNPMQTFINYVQSDVPKIEEKAESIPQQINAILQEQIEGTPLKEKGVSVSEWPGRGVVFIVGIDLYDEIAGIPDPVIQQAVRRAVKTWEKQQEE